ncbi:Carboxylesterase [Syncephalis fuscata]|nr:Carboxylesterase [Syncephalis fuscata]
MKLLAVAIASLLACQTEATSLKDAPMTDAFAFFSKLQAPSAYYGDRESTSTTDDDVLVVPTEYGRIRGKIARISLTSRVMDKVLGWTNKYKLDAKQYPRSFQGIPFAAPPIGENRFKHPQPFNASWGGIRADGSTYGKIRDATVLGNECPQPFPPFSQSEDCLHLNVYTPSAKRIKELGGRVAVMFWLYPGAYIVGGSYQYGFYDGAYLAEKKDVIVVTSNYRMGPLGFLAASDDHANAGIVDQAKALEWVKRNIASFGGDPDNITLWGLSAGAYSVLIHMTSPATPPGLFHRAIMQSPPIGHRVRSRHDIEAENMKLAKQMRCSIPVSSGNVIDMACLQKVSWKAIVAASALCITYGTPGIKEITDEFKWWPYRDGKIITDEPRNLILSGHYKDVPIIIGSTKDEAGLWSMLFSLPVIKKVIGSHNDYTVKGYMERITRVFGNFSEQYLELYPIKKNDVEIEVETSNGGTDIVWRCPIDRTMASIAKRGATVYVYEFLQKSKKPWFGMCLHRSCHMGDLVQTWKKDHNILLDKEQEKIGDDIQTYWTNFAKTGNPNTDIPLRNSLQESRLNWPRFDENKRLRLNLDDQLAVTSNKYEHFCEFWDKAGIDY